MRDWRLAGDVEQMLDEVDHDYHDNPPERDEPSAQDLEEHAYSKPFMPTRTLGPDDVPF